MACSSIGWSTLSSIPCVGSVVGTFFAAMAGFAFRRYHFFGRKLLFILILGFALVPGFATTLPLFIEFKNFHFLNTAWAIIVPSVLNIFGVYLMVVYWNQVPEEMFDAAMMDGTREFFDLHADRASHHPAWCDDRSSPFIRGHLEQLLPCAHHVEHATKYSP